MELEHHCRLCSELKRTEDVVQIFDVIGLESKLQEKIWNRLHLWVDESDFLSQVMCFRCYTYLENFDSFVKKVAKTQHQLLVLKLKTNPEECKKNTVQEKEVAVTSSEENVSTSNSSQFVIELSDDENMDCIYDSDVEFIETDIKPFFGLCSDDRKFSNDTAFLTVKDELKDWTPERKPDIYTGRQEIGLQVGNCLKDSFALMENEFERVYGIPINENAVVETTQIQGKGTRMSADAFVDKGCQIKIEMKLKQKGSRIRPFLWSRAQKLAMRESFPKHFDMKTVPSLEQAKSFIGSGNHLFENVNYLQVRRYFYNRRQSAGFSAKRIKMK